MDVGFTASSRLPTLLVCRGPSRAGFVLCVFRDILHIFFLMQNIRNFVIIAHIDHGKSTLADRLLEITGTVEKRQMQAQYLDGMDLERERGITIKMTPVRMIYQYHSDRGLSRNETRTDAEAEGLLYEDSTFKIRGAAYEVRKKIGFGHKESVYQAAFAEELSKRGVNFEREKRIDIFYETKKIGTYQPDFVIDGKILVELKALPEIGRPQTEQLWSYLKGSSYRLALMINFGSVDLDIKRVVYDTARVSSPRDSALSRRQSAQVEEEYILNLIDTPGHSDFGYEVSRALVAVEGAILLVDATQGIQAQTLSNFEQARKAGLTMIGVVNKIDIATSEMVESAVTDLSELLKVSADQIYKVSGKTGEGVEALLRAVVETIPSPSNSKGQVSAVPSASRALVFDSQYDDHRGVIAFIRVFSGSFELNKNYHLVATGAEVKTKDIGYLKPGFKSGAIIHEGEIGYIATGIKDPDQLKIGDTIASQTYADGTRINADDFAKLALPGYKEPKPVVFVSFYPDESDDYDDFKKALAKLRLSDSALQFEPDKSEVLGRGFKGGFLGKLHFEIASERIEREFHIPTLSSFPSVAYRVKLAKQSHIENQRQSSSNLPVGQASQLESAEFMIVNNPKDLPDEYVEVLEPMTHIEILTPLQYMGPILQLKELYRLSEIETRPFGTHGAGTHKDKMLITAKLPLADLISDFDDKVKSVSQGYGSLSYEVIGYEKGEVDKVEILVAEILKKRAVKCVSV